MSIPGANLYKMATRLIAQTPFSYYKWLERDLNDIGLDVNQYAPPLKILGSVQPVARNMYMVYGLDLQKNYKTIYAPLNMIDIARDRSSDIVVVNKQTYQALSNTDWFPIDGWVATIFVEVPNVGQCTDC